MSATFITASVILSTISPWIAESSIIGATVFTYESVFKIWLRDHTATTEAASNTPLTLVFVFFVFILPGIGIILPLGTLPAVIALTVYTSAFVCEAVRSGINTVGIGQAEAARAIGLGSVGTLRLIVLPQALRTVVPPLISVLIALAKNTSVASGFAVVELTATGRGLARDYPADVIWMLLGVAAFYLLITIPAGYAASRIERRVVFSR